MLHAIQYSLIERIKSEVPTLTDVLWHYGGMTINQTLPYATVESLPTNVAILDKQASHISNVYHFQVGVFLRDASELAKMQDVVAKKLCGNIPLFDTDGEEAEVTNNFIRGEVTNVSPLPVESTEGISGYHRFYADVQVFNISNI